MGRVRMAPPAFVAHGSRRAAATAAALLTMRESDFADTRLASVASVARIERSEIRGRAIAVMDPGFHFVQSGLRARANPSGPAACSWPRQAGTAQSAPTPRRLNPSGSGQNPVEFPLACRREPVKADTAQYKGKACGPRSSATSEPISRGTGFIHGTRYTRQISALQYPAFPRKRETH